MTKVTIFSGFLGAGKTTLIKKLVSEVYKGEKLLLIENEFGDIAIDGGFMSEAGIKVSEISSGCICCSLVGDFTKALGEAICEYAPDRVLIEPSGVAKLSDVIAAVNSIKEQQNIVLDGCVAVADAGKCKMYAKNFGEFYQDQIHSAGAILLSRTQNIDKIKLSEAVKLLRGINEHSPIVTTAWDELEPAELEQVLSGQVEQLVDIHEAKNECACQGEHHHEHEDGHKYACQGEQHHEHEDGHKCACQGEHHHEHEDGHEHHHADELFTSWGKESPLVYKAAQISAALAALDSGEYGEVLRAKGIVPCDDGSWLHFDYVPHEQNLRTGPAAYTGRLCVIGSCLREDKLAALFGGAEAQDI